MPTLKPITIVGGGLAGLTLGIGLRQRGIPVTVWEAGHYPRHRVCGEFISGRGQDVLDAAGLAELVSRRREQPSPTRRLSIWAGALLRRGPCPHPRCACRASPWTRCWPGICGRRVVSCARMRAGGKQDFGEGVVRASGRRLQPPADGGGWFGLKVHARNVPLAADLEMHGSHTGYVGFCRLARWRGERLRLIPPTGRQIRRAAALARPSARPAGHAFAGTPRWSIP